VIVAKVISLICVFYCIVMMMLTVGEEGPKDWYGNPIEEEEDDDPGDHSESVD
jgi:hypothetical protein